MAGNRDTWEEAWNRAKTSLTPEKRRWDAHYPWLTWVLRPTSLFLAAACYRFGVSANQVTLLSVIALVGAFIGFSQGYLAGFIIGSLLTTLFNLLDCVDGNLARMAPEPHPGGQFLDALAGMGFYGVYFFIGIGLYRGMDGPGLALGGWVLGSSSPQPIGALWLAIGAWTTLMRLVVMQINQLVQARLYPEIEKSQSGQGLTTTARGLRLRVLHVNATDLQAHDFLLLFATLVHGMSLFLLVSALLATVDVGLQVTYFARRALRLGP